MSEIIDKRKIKVGFAIQRNLNFGGEIKGVGKSVMREEYISCRNKRGLESSKWAGRIKV